MVDGIYPRLSIFAKTVRQPSNVRDRKYAKFQEGIRKDVERFFGILKKCFQFLHKAVLKKNFDFVLDLMMCCVILYNMRLHDSLKDGKKLLDDDEMREVEAELAEEEESSQDEVEEDEDFTFITPEMRQRARERLNEIESLEEHQRLQEALKDNL